VDGNKRAALGACIVFLRLNGIEPRPDGSEWEDMNRLKTRLPESNAKHIPRRTDEAADAPPRLVRQGECCQRVGATPTGAVETTALPILNCIVTA